jgi:hypothetical protein
MANIDWSQLLTQTAKDNNAKAVMADAVDTERDRRINAGVTFNNVLFQTREEDRNNIDQNLQLAFQALVGGAQPQDLRWASPATDFQWIAADNSMVSMDAQTMVDFGKAAAARKQAITFAARALKNMTPIPTDYTLDKWWP